MIRPMPDYLHTVGSFGPPPTRLTFSVPVKRNPFHADVVAMLRFSSPHIVEGAADAFGNVLLWNYVDTPRVTAETDLETWFARIRTTEGRVEVEFSRFAVAAGNVDVWKYGRIVRLAGDWNIFVGLGLQT